MSFALRRFLVRRKFLTLAGASFYVLDPEERVVAFCRQKAFKLKEDIRVYTDETQTTELLVIGARQVIDFSAAYDVVDSAERRKLGAARRKGWSSLLRDSWELLDADDRPVAQLTETSELLALLRRFLTNLIPPSYRLSSPSGTELATFRARFNPLVLKLDVTVANELDPRLALALALLVAVVEGRQN